MTNAINLADLAKTVPPAANLNGHVPSSGVSLVDLIQRGVPEQFIGQCMAANVRLVDIPKVWAENQAKAAPVAPKVDHQRVYIPAKSTAPANETPEQELARLRAEKVTLLKQIENDRIKAANRSLSCKVSEKGALSVYGMGRFPVTLYREQWEKLFKNQEMIETFILENMDKLATKGE